MGGFSAAFLSGIEYHPADVVAERFLLSFVKTLCFHRRQDRQNHMAWADPFSSVGFHDFIGAIDRERDDRCLVFYRRFESAVFEFADLFSFASGAFRENDDGVAFRDAASRFIDRSQRFPGIAAVDKDAADEIHPGFDAWDFRERILGDDTIRLVKIPQHDGNIPVLPTA